MILRFYFIIGIVMLIMSGCGGRETGSRIPETELKSRLEKANKIMVQHERKDIEEFILRHQLHMDSTGTGLRYQIYLKGSGRQPVPHETVVIAYRVFFLSSDLVYEKTIAHPDTLRLAEGMSVNGVEEALYLMNKGSKARLILPSHLAYGITGDDNKIPGATPLYYDLQLIDFMQ